MKEDRLTVAGEEAGRLDAYLASRPGLDLSRSHAKKLIEDGDCLVDGRPAKASLVLKPGQEVWVRIPEPEPLEIVAQDIPLDIVYEDEDVIVINKPRGLVVHPAAGNWSGTLVNALVDHCDDLGGIGGTLRPGIVHRLDKDTTGLLVVAKNAQSQENLSCQIKDREVKRQYLALVHGNPPVETAIVDAPIGRHPVDRKRMAVNTRTGRPAVTRFHVVERFGEYSLLECRLETGRTHQIRVHLSYIGHPVVGDPVYGTRKAHLDLKAQALHAEKLGFTHPRTGEYLEFTVEPPEDMREAIRQLRAVRDGVD